MITDSTPDCSVLLMPRKPMCLSLPDDPEIEIVEIKNAGPEDLTIDPGLWRFLDDGENPVIAPHCVARFARSASGWVQF